MKELLAVGNGPPDPWKREGGRAGWSFAAAAAGTLDNLLAQLDVRGKARQHVRGGGLDLEAVMAWYLYTLAQDWTTRPIGYLIQRAAAGEAPPERYARLSRLRWELWRTHAVGAGLRTLLAPEGADLLAGLPGFRTWNESYENWSPEVLPFDVGWGLEEIRALLAARLDPPSASGRETVRGAAAVSPADAAAWSAALQELSLQMTRATFDMLLKGAQLVSRTGDEYVIGVHSQSAKEWLESRLSETVARTLAATAEVEPGRLRFVAVSRDAAG